jgi:hypothetical protein
MAKLKEHYDTAESDVGFCLVSLNELEWNDVHAGNIDLTNASLCCFVVNKITLTEIN